MTKKIIYILITILVLLATNATAQEDDSTHDFVARRSVIFDDNFADDSLGDFPAGWRICVCNGDKYIFDTAHCSIVRTDSGNAIIIRFDTAFITNIEPTLEPNTYLPDSFSLEFDFRLGSARASMDCGLNLMSNACYGEGFSLYNKDNKGYILNHDAFYPKEGQVDGGHYVRTSPLPGFNYTVWHHFALSFYRQDIKCYVDKQRVMHLPECHYSPNSFSISCSVDHAVYYRNVRVATGMEPSRFDSILTEQRLITHAIHFDTDSATIKPESMAFINQLAAWMRAHPRVRLEIDGHTDNDGNEETNLKLSQARANEVKKQLTLLGITEARLSATGYGATRPIQPNDTPEGKSQNRRVEFVKQ